MWPTMRRREGSLQALCARRACGAPPGGGWCSLTVDLCLHMSWVLKVWGEGSQIHKSQRLGSSWEEVGSGRELIADDSARRGG